MSNNSRKDIILSVKEKDYDEAQNTKFSISSVRTSDLKKLFIEKNYSPIIWQGSRLKANFLYASGFVIDIDTGLTIQKAKTILKKQNLNYALVSSKSHTAAAHRFHLLIPFSRKIYTIKNFESVVGIIKAKLFPDCDPAVLDGARFIYGSPDNAEFSDNWSGVDYDVDAGLGKQIPDAWNDKLEVKTIDGRTQKAILLTVKTPIVCPFHDDNHQSAFITRNGNKEEYYIHCSACDKTYWKVKAPLKDRCERFWSHGTDVLEFGIAGEAFYMHPIGKEKFMMFVDAMDKAEKGEAFRFLLDNKHIPHLKVVNHISNPKAKESGYEVDTNAGSITVHYSPRSAVIQDNAFIESYLESTFGTHKDFIKRWLAVYCYTNYRDLPTLIFKGGRGNGKNTFAEMVYSIFPTISQMWEAERRNFTPEAEKKLLIADETVCDDPEQYKLLKQYAGSKYATVNKKYLPTYEVPNNMNIIILSNSAIPVYVSRDEKPTSDENNQFFVYEFKPFAGAIDPELDKKLEDRIGHYVRTELKTVFEGLNFNGNRYSIKTPITAEEAGLFESNVTEAESDIEKLIDRIVDRAAEPSFEKGIRELLESGWIPTRLIEDHSGFTKLATVKIIKQLQEQEYIKMTESKKLSIKGSKERPRCREMTDKLKSQIKFFDPKSE